MASDASVPVPAAAQPVPKRRGNYNCGRCGLPKKGHVCPIPGPAASANAGKAGEPPQPQNKPRRALQFDPVAAAAEAVVDAVPLAMAPPLPPPVPGRKRARVEVVVDVEGEEGEEADDEEDEEGPGWVQLGDGRRAPGEVLVEVLRRLAPRGVAAAAGVSRGWRECARRVWRGAEEVRLGAAGVGPVGALTARCPALARLVLRMDR